MNQTAVREILEALRGKTIIDNIRLGYELNISNSAINKLQKDFDISIGQDSTYINIRFQVQFLTYVQWPYFSVVEQIQKVSGRAESLDIYAHQLFEGQNKNFALRFNEKGMAFQNRKNIEDTLFLDIQRYCEHNEIIYEVN
ncbi:MAG: hypothetical protein KKF65_02260 [Nanoarchaeota archaeon]|nr:hypothetical protein [Nanoarchaeota archaeon]